MKILFPYSNCIAEIEALAFNQGEIVKHGDPVIVPEHSWEGVLAYLYGSVVKTTLYKMWYQAGGVYVGYARSRDGIRWQKPMLNAFALEQPHIGPTVDASDGEGNYALVRPTRCVPDPTSC